MLAVFCLRLATGMLACLPLLVPSQVNPRYYRTHFLTVLGLAGVTLLTLYDSASWPVMTFLISAICLVFLGSLSWALDGAPGGRTLILLSLASIGAALVLHDSSTTVFSVYFACAGDLTSALLLGAALSAMLMGHMYLIAPGMSLSPLMRLFAVLVVTILARMVADGYALWCWTAAHPSVTLTNDILLWLPVRWGVGFLLPLALTWMAWQSARIRSTQSATGILYVGVIFCFLGELTGLLLRNDGLTL